MTDVGRNALCPCGSGLRYKRCCLGRKDEAALDAMEAERTWNRMQSWALERFGDELGAALKEHMDARGVGTDERPAMDDDLSLVLCWLLIDRELAEGSGAPAQLYANLPQLTAPEREIATRIATCGLGLHRVTDVDSGASIGLENVLTGARTCVTSRNVSREAVRWHVLLCRVMVGGPTPSLWGAAGFYEPAEEVELLASSSALPTPTSLAATTPRSRPPYIWALGARVLHPAQPSRRARAVHP